MPLLNCRNKKIKVSGKGKPKVEISLNKKRNLTSLVSGIKAMKCIWKGATGYLAYLMNDPLEPLKAENIPVIKEYLEVFPEELTSLTPNREIEFPIDLIPGTALFPNSLTKWLQ